MVAILQGLAEICCYRSGMDPDIAGLSTRFGLSNPLPSSVRIVLLSFGFLPLLLLGVSFLIFASSFSCFGHVTLLPLYATFHLFPYRKDAIRADASCQLSTHGNFLVEIHCENLNGDVSVNHLDLRIRISPFSEFCHSRTNITRNDSALCWLIVPDVFLTRFSGNLFVLYVCCYRSTECFLLISNVSFKGCLGGNYLRVKGF